jgi:hypothetical protein
MGRHVESPGVQETAATALCNLAQDLENLRKIGAQVVHIHEHTRIYVPLQSQTHTHTYTHTQGAIEALVAAMSRHPANVGLQERTTAALCNLANDLETKHKIGAQVVHTRIYVPLQSQTHTHTHTHTHTGGD